MTSFDALVRFIDFTLLFRSVERTILIKGKEHDENDAEHVCQLALAAWYLNDTQKLGLSSDKLLKLALAHDLVETYAGDVNVYETGEKAKNKHVEEMKAFVRIKKEFPDATTLHEAIEEYEAQETDEAKCIKALDKIIPGINIFLDDGRYWKNDGISLEQMKEIVTPKAISYEPVAHFWHELIERLEHEHDEYFPPKT